jgi:hypothetical protein
MAHHPGEVWFLPPEAEEGGDPKCRRHVLLTPCEDVGDIGVFSYASTRPTEVRFGASYLLVRPSPRGAFTQMTWVYLSRLVPVRSESFLRVTGQLIDEMPQLRRLLRHALGIGTGTGSADGGGWRGRFVRLSRSRSESIGYEHAIVVTEPRYSERQRYQIVVPVDDLRAFEPQLGDVTVTTGEWFRAIASDVPGVLVAIPDVQSVFHLHDIDDWAGTVVDGATMAKVEAALLELFDL